MILILHVLTGIVSLILSTAVLLVPNKLLLRGIYYTTLLTVISGTLVVFTANANVVQACISGAFYLGFVTVSTFITHRRLAKEI